ncbi:DUF4360 domain-containing protein [Nocardia arthritidis]|uniref:DUF4360 domain-containing protein n=1 Tax=Nocardia arthritidis TaxID=228602 RepID=A0A6G9YI72_9NOCA|nr:DUF4360 domain-containing protein [Nocardia arthritidis]QIS12860.1 DUF4360 domain-containing protein [Nocardia arthritidis]
MFKKFAAVGAAIFAFAIPISSSQSSADPVPGWNNPPPPDKIVIDVVTVNGTGCPPGTAAVAVSPDNTAFTVTYSQYTAQVGVGAGPTDFRRNCQLNLLVHVPQGFTYGIAQADYRGFAHLEAGATALERARYYFQGNSPTQYIDHPFNGLYDDDWQTTDSTPVGSVVFLPCGENRNFNINTELRANAGTSDPTKTTSFITMDSTDGSITTTYHFAWKQC